MPGRYDKDKQWTELGTPSKKTGKVPKYTVSLKEDNTWECSCSNWCTTVPREDCKHIGRRIKTLIQENSPYVRYLLGKQEKQVITSKANIIHNEEETHRTILFGDV
jgi:hypothetical protein